MTPLPGYDGTFITQMRKSFGTQKVTVIHPVEGETDERFEAESQVQSEAAFFDVNVPIYRGDRIEMGDPRGGTREVWVTNVKINQAGGQMPSGMSHIKAAISDQASEMPDVTKSPQTTYGDYAIVVSGGSHVTIATHGGSIDQGKSVPPEFNELAKAVKLALELIQNESSFDGDEREIAKQASSDVLQEIIKDDPNPSKLKGALATLRGVLTAATNSASSAAASGIIQQLFPAAS